MTKPTWHSDDLPLAAPITGAGWLRVGLRAVPLVILVFGGLLVHMALRLPEFVQQVAPFAIYVAIVLTMGRLYAEQEMVVLQGFGLVV